MFNGELKSGLSETLIDFIEKQVNLYPDRTGIVCLDEKITYRELDSRSNLLANYLLRNDIKNSIVGIMVEKSIESVVAMLGVLKSGNTYLYIETDNPINRINYIIKDSGCEIIIVKDEKDLKIDRQIISIENVLMSETNISKPDIQVSENAYIMYTSGSTGNPKGVSIQHSSIVNLQKSLFKKIFNSEYDYLNVTVNASFSFDASVQQFLMLSFGHTLHLIPKELKLDNAALIKYINENNINLLDTTPSHLKYLIEDGLFNKVYKLQKLLIGGEAIDVKLWRELNRLKGLDSYNLYGPTECTVDSTISIIKESHIPNIGKPIDNACIYILDSDFNHVQEGEVGEIYIGGLGVGLGYVNNFKLTAERFLPDPYNKKLGSRMYRSGDLGCLSRNGLIEFKGRADNQIKIFGHRIELEEIDSVLKMYPSVLNAVSIVKGEKTTKRIESFVITDGRVSEKELREYLFSNVPHYMIPSTIKFIENSPLNSSGKIDKQKLLNDFSKKHTSKVSLIERELISILKEILKLKDIEVTDNFFQIGGNSLRATQVISRIHSTLRVEVDFHAFFLYPTIQELAKHIEQLKRKENNKTIISNKKNIMERYPLSYPQERIWFISNLYNENKTYNFQTTFKFVGELNVRVLKRALSLLMENNDIFKTTFHIDKEGNPYQKLNKQPILDFKQVDLMEADLEEFIHKELKTSFNLDSLPLIKWVLIKVKLDEFILLHIEHHIIHDGWSFNVFIEDLSNTYNSLLANEKHLPQTKEIDFIDYCLWQRKNITRESVKDQIIYWRNQLSGSPKKIFNSNPDTFQGNSLKVDLPINLSRKVVDFSRKLNVTPFMTLYTVFVTFLYAYTNQKDLWVGSTLANRKLIDVERIIGMFVNTVVLRSFIEDGITFKQMLEHCKKVIIGANKNQDVPFDWVVEALNPVRKYKENPLFQVSFSFHDASLSKVKFNGLELEVSDAISNGSSKFDLSVIVIPKQEREIGAHSKEEKGMHFIWEYNTNIFDKDTIDSIWEHYKQFIIYILDNPNEELSYFSSLLSNSNQHEVNQLSTQLEVDPVYKHSEDFKKNELELQVAKIWEDVLKVEGINRTDNFFELGGTSLMIFKINSRIQDVIGVHVPISTYFINPNLSDFCLGILKLKNEMSGIKVIEKRR